MSAQSNDNIVVLTVKSQKASGEKVFRLHKKRAVLGSATSSDVRLEDQEVSPVHAILEVSGVDGKPVVYDLASESGIMVNGKATVQASLSPQDTIKIGPYLIQVRIQPLGELATESASSKSTVRESFGQKLFVTAEEDLKPLILEDESQVFDIFDHTPESKMSLQVTMFFNETILDVEHFVNKKRIVIGPGAREDFSIPPFLGHGKTGRFDLVTNQDGQYFLHLHENMQGVVNKNGTLMPIKESTSDKMLPLLDRDFAKVKFHDVSFFLNFTPAPPKLKSKRFFERDPFFMKIWFASIALTAALLYTVSTITVNPMIEIEQLPERVATILYEPKNLPVDPALKPKEEPKPEQKTPPAPQVIKITPKPVTSPAPVNAVIGQKTQDKQQQKSSTPQATQAKNKGAAQKAGGQEGAGAKAKGAEGQRGAQNKPQASTPQNAAKRPGEGKPTNGPAMNRGHSQVTDMGVVDIFKSNKGTLSKILAGGKGASNAASQLEGYSGFTSKGQGGLGAAGSEKGGGGQSLGLGGLADKGPGGGKHGTGLGALGSAGNLLGGSGKLAVDSGGSPEPIVVGAIDSDAIMREIEKHKDEIKYCYEKEVNAERPDLAGRVGIRFVIGASGTVTSAGLSSTTLKHAPTESCVIEVIKRIQFPPVKGGGVADVTVPFVFKPSNR